MKQLSAFKHNQLWPNFTLFFAAIIFAFVLCEITARFLLPDLFHGLFNVQKNNPLRFIPHSHATYKTPEFEVDFDINEFGRRDISWNSETSNNQNHILFVGDSMVLGYGLAMKDSIPTKIEDLFSEVGIQKEVFNYGMGGSISLPEYRMLIQDAFASRIAAKQILVGIFIGNDFSVTPVLQKISIWEKHSRILQWLKRALAASPDLIRFLFRAGSALGVNVYQSPESYLFSLAPGPERQHFEQTLMEISRIKTLAQSENRDVSIIIFPTKLQVENAEQLSHGPNQYDLPNEAIRKYCSSEQIPVLDLLPILKQHYDQMHQSLFFPVDRHLNLLGSIIAAKAIFQFIVNQSNRE